MLPCLYYFSVLSMCVYGRGIYSTFCLNIKKCYSWAMKVRWGMWGKWSDRAQSQTAYL
jgi:hypothetical protein